MFFRSGVYRNSNEYTSITDNIAIARATSPDAATRMVFGGSAAMPSMDDDDTLTVADAERRHR